MARTHAVAGLSSTGAESLAVRAGDLVFTSALTASSLGIRLGSAGEEMRAIGAGLARVLAVLGSKLEHGAKRKCFVSEMRRLPTIEAALPEALSHAAGVSVGAGLPGFGDRLAVELVAGAENGPTVHERGGLRAARLGALVFTGGCGPFDGGGLVAAGDLSTQGTLALENLRAALALAGATTDGLVKVNNTTACWHDYRLYNAAYNEILAGSNAARCSVSGALRDPLSLMEVEGVAALGEDLAFVDSTQSGVGRTGFTRRADTLYLPELGPCKGPHSHGARAGDIVHIAGECPYDAEDRLVGPGDIEAQTMRTLDNIRIGLEALGAGIGDVVKTSVTLSDVRLQDGFERAYRSVFSAPYPVRSLVATPLGQSGILVEIEAVAIVGAATQASFAVGAS